MLNESRNSIVERITYNEGDINFKPSCTIKLIIWQIHLTWNISLSGPYLIVLTNKFMAFLLFEALSKVILKILLCIPYYLKTLVQESYMEDPSWGWNILGKPNIFFCNFIFEFV